MKWGNADASANRTLLIVGLLLAVVCWLLATGYDSAAARVREQGNWCWRTGPRADIPLVSDDGETWLKP